MPYEFQLVSVCLEDRIPHGIPDNVDKTDLLQDDFLEVVDPVRQENRVENSCVAFLFGRMQDGRSICVRVNGVRPKLYFDATGLSEAVLRRELAKELTIGDRGNVNSYLHIERVQFANFNGYEPDPASASGRKIHEYFKVEYASLQAWRKAVALRKQDDAAIRKAHAERAPIPSRQWRLAHEYNVDPMTRFLRENDLLPGGWNAVTTVVEPKCVVSTCDVEVEVAQGGSVHALRSRFDMAPYVTLYYDLETLGLDPETSGIIQVSLVFEAGGVVDKHCVCLHSVSPLDGVTLHCVSTEERLLLRVRRLIMERDPDFVVAYNGVNFDNRFLNVRAAKYNTHGGAFFHLSRFAMHRCRLRELSLASSGMGDNQFTYFDMPGRANVDFFVKFKVDEPSEISWSLSHFTRKYIPGEDKEEMKYTEIPLLQAGSDDDRRRLASYCVHDSYLLHLLNKTRNILGIVLQFAQVFGVLPEWVYLRGQQVRFISQLFEGVRTLEAIPLLIQTPPTGFVGMFDGDGFEGATVNDPISGFYDRNPIATLDWKSLYPSIMLAHNLCHSTHVVDPRLYAYEGVVAHNVRTLGLTWQEEREDTGSERLVHEELATALVRERRSAMMEEKQTVNIPRIVRLPKETWGHLHVTAGTRIRIDGGGESVYMRPVGEHTTYFTTKHRGILPRILENLLAERVRCKKQMKDHAKRAKELRDTDPAKAAEHAALADVFDGRQLAVKVSANSVYGACGAGVSGKCPNKDVSETVTFEGRETMVILKEILVAKYPDAVVIYGDTDSVMIKFDHVCDVAEMAKLSNEVANHITEEFARRGYPDMVLEFEKIFFPYLLLKKKRYIGLKYDADGDDMVFKGIDAKGVETERKDTLPFLKKIYFDVRDQLMYQRDAIGAFARLEAHLWRLIRNEVPFEDLILSKGLRSSYKDASTQVQCCVNEKKKRREPGSEAAVGDRVWYVIVNGPEKAKTTELAEDPDYVKRHGLKLNRLWYFEHAIRTPMESLFSHIEGVDVAPLFARVVAELKREKMGGTSLRHLLGPSSSTVPTIKSHIPRPPPPPPPKRKKR